MSEPAAGRSWRWPADLTAYRDDLARMLAASVADDGILGYAAPLTVAQGTAFCADLQAGVDKGEKLVVIGADELGTFGMCVLTTTAMPNCRHLAEASKAYLDPRVRRTGAVAELVLAVCARMREEGVQRLRIDVREGSPAHLVWQRFGFTTFGILDDYSRINGVSYRGHFMAHSVDELSRTANELLAVGRRR
jgi:L-amino acid N-acyltransferase YncA